MWDCRLQVMGLFTYRMAILTLIVLASILLATRGQSPSWKFTLHLIVWMERDESSPYEYTPEILNTNIFYSLVAKASGIESDQSDIVSAVPRSMIAASLWRPSTQILVWLKCSYRQACYNSAFKFMRRRAYSVIRIMRFIFYANLIISRMENAKPLSELVSLVYAERGIQFIFFEKTMNSFAGIQNVGKQVCN